MTSFWHDPSFSTTETWDKIFRFILFHNIIIILLLLRLVIMTDLATTHPDIPGSEFNSFFTGAVEPELYIQGIWFFFTSSCGSGFEALMNSFDEISLPDGILSSLDRLTTTVNVYLFCLAMCV